MKYFIINSIDWEHDLIKDGWNYDDYIFNNVKYKKNDCVIVVDAEMRDGFISEGNEELSKSFQIKS
jgi:hypothetical protein